MQRGFSFWEGPPATPRSRGCHSPGSDRLVGSDRPHEPSELARARNDDLLAGLAAARHLLPATVKALLAAPRTLENLRALAAVAASQLVADGRAPPGVPPRLDQQPAAVPGAGPR